MQPEGSGNAGSGERAASRADRRRLVAVVFLFTLATHSLVAFRLLPDIAPFAKYLVAAGQCLDGTITPERLTGIDWIA